MSLTERVITVNVLKFQTPVACLKGLMKQHSPNAHCFLRSSLTRVFAVCLSDMHFVNFSPDNQHFVGNRKRKVLEIIEHLPKIIIRSLTNHDRILFHHKAFISNMTRNDFFESFL